MISDARSRCDQATLAYELMIGTILRELGFPDADGARAWARFWLCDPADEGAQAAHARELTARLMASDLPLSTIAQVHCRLAALEVSHLAAGDQADLAALSGWIEASNARLVMLLACVEGERVCAALDEAPAVLPYVADQAVAALAEAAGFLNRSLNGLRASAASRDAA